MKKVFLGLSFTVAALGSLTISSLNSQAADGQKMYRLYNPNSGEHFYTANANERDFLIGNWEYEGVGWYAPTSGDPVYRLYNPNAGDHHYTLNSYEKNSLINAGWNYEGIGWYSDTNHSIPLHRAYNPRAKAGSHNYTTNAAEQNNLINAGWKNEGISWYAVGHGKAGQSIPYHKLNPNDPLQKSAQFLLSRIVIDVDEIRIYPVFSGMIQSISGYYQGYPELDETMATIKETIRTTSQHSNGRPVTLISRGKGGGYSETIVTAQNGTITYFLEK